MDTTKATINNILYTIEHYPYQKDDLEWGTEEVMILISRIKELEEGIKKHEAGRHKIRPYTFCESDRQLYQLVSDSRGGEDGT